MVEIIQAIGGASIWLLVFLVLVTNLNKKRGKPILDGSGVLVCYPIFFLFQIVLVKLLDLLHLLNSRSIIVVYLLMLVLSVFTRRKIVAVSADDIKTPDLADILVKRITLISVGIVMLSLIVFSFIAPIHIWDVQAYHMPMVANYVQNETLASWPTQELRQVFRVNGAELQMLNLALLSASDAWMELPNILALAVSLIATFLIAKRTFGQKNLAYLSVILVMTAPQILLGSVTAKNDIIFMSTILVAFYWVLTVAFDSASNLRSCMLHLGLCASLAAATKVMGINLLGTVTVVIFMLALRKRVPHVALTLFSVFSIMFLIVLVGDIYWHNFYRSRMPVGIVPGEVSFTIGQTNFISAAKLYLYELGFQRLVILQTWYHDFAHFGYFFPFLVFFGISGAIRQWLEKSKRNVGLSTLTLLSVILFLSVIVVRVPIRWDQRFMIWMVPVSTILALSLMRKCRSKIVLIAVSFSSAFCINNVFAIYTNSEDGIFAKSAFYLVKHHHLARFADVSVDEPGVKILGYDVRDKIQGFGVLDREAGDTDWILYVGGEDTWMYSAWGRQFTRHVDGVADVSDVQKKIKSGNYKFLVLEYGAPEELKGATYGAVKQAGYCEISNGRGRSIFKRDSQAKL